MLGPVLALFVASIPPVGTASVGDAQNAVAMTRPRILLVAIRHTENRLQEIRQRAFEESFEEAAGGVFAWRRFDVRYTDACSDETCANALAVRERATHWLTFEIKAIDERDCVAIAKRFEASTSSTKHEQIEIRPCLVDNILGRAADLGRRLADGPRHEPTHGLMLTPLSIPDLDIPDIGDMPAYRTSTAARTLSGYALERALEVYRSKHVIVFEQDGRLHMARNSRVINDCELMRAASKPVYLDLLEHCEGNWWELAWGTIPVGGLIAYAGSDAVVSGDQESFFVFAGGILVGLTGPLLALVLNVDASESGEHFVTEDRVRSIASDFNAELRKSLALSEAEVTVAGMRL